MAFPKEPKGAGAYVREVTENTRRYLKEIREENESLRGGMSMLLGEKSRLERQLEEIHHELELFRVRQAALQAQLSDAERQGRQHAERHLKVEQQTSSLSNLYVASHRLHEAADLEGLYDIIHEIVGNMVGSEEVTIYEVDPLEPALRRVSSMGPLKGRPERVGLDEGPIGRSVLKGEIYIAPGENPHNGLTACVPLRRCDRVVGVIAIYALLPQKPALEPVDHELFALLSTQAGLALHCARLEAGAPASAGLWP